MKKAVKIFGVLLGLISILGGIQIFKTYKEFKDFYVCEFGN